MNYSLFLKKLLPSLLPIIVFIIADEIFGTIIGLIIALAFGIIEFIVSFIILKKRDSFLIFDIVFLLILGGISLLLENEFFFKLKPGLIQLLFCGILALSAFSSKNLIELMSKKYMGDIKITPEHQLKMKKNLKILFVIFILHTLLIFYSAYFMSKQAWAFISGVLIYIIIGVYFLFEFIRFRFFTKRKL